MIRWINESKILTKDISCEYKFKLDKRKYNLNQWWNNDKSRYKCKKIHICQKDHIWSPALCNCENGKYFASIMDKIICDEIIDTKETNFDEKNIACKIQSFYILLAFLLITTTYW